MQWINDLYIVLWVWNQEAELGVAPLTITPRDPNCESVLPTPAILCSPEVEIPGMRGRHPPTTGQSQGSARVMDKRLRLIWDKVGTWTDQLSPHNDNNIPDDGSVGGWWLKTIHLLHHLTAQYPGTPHRYLDTTLIFFIYWRSKFKLNSVIEGKGGGRKRGGEKRRERRSEEAQEGGRKEGTMEERMGGRKDRWKEGTIEGRIEWGQQAAILSPLTETEIWIYSVIKLI